MPGPMPGHDVPKLVEERDGAGVVRVPPAACRVQPGMCATHCRPEMPQLFVYDGEAVVDVRELVLVQDWQPLNPDLCDRAGRPTVGEAGQVGHNRGDQVTLDAAVPFRQDPNFWSIRKRNRRFQNIDVRCVELRVHDQDPSLGRCHRFNEGIQGKDVDRHAPRCRDGTPSEIDALPVGKPTDVQSAPKGA